MTWPAGLFVAASRSARTTLLGGCRSAWHGRELRERASAQNEFVRLEENLVAAIDDLTELVEASAAAERFALASKWKERSDVETMATRMRKRAEEHREH